MKDIQDKFLIRLHKTDVLFLHELVRIGVLKIDDSQGAFSNARNRIENAHSFRESSVR